jgi:hypothetical protein
MIRARNLRNKYQKRTLRVIVGQTQATPFAGALTADFRNTDGTFALPKAATATNPSRTADAFTMTSGGLPAGLVMIPTGDNTFKVAAGSATEKPFGLLANFVGGDLDDLGDENAIGVWYGKDAMIELLAPAFDPTGITTSAITTASNAGTQIALRAGLDGRVTARAADSGSGNPATNAPVIGFLHNAGFSGTTPVNIIVRLAI